MEKFTLEEVKTDEQIEALAALAKEIWTEHFTSMLEEGQVEYMLEKFQSPSSIRAQLKEGYQYYFLKLYGELAGYTGFHAEEESLFLSKIYVRKAMRGKKIAKQAIEYMISLCRERHLHKIWLTVNRNNSIAIAAYEKMGFTKAYMKKADIGNGFYMDDYIMEKKIHA